jgi:hypothetical protein
MSKDLKPQFAVTPFGALVGFWDVVFAMVGLLFMTIGVLWLRIRAGKKE